MKQALRQNSIGVFKKNLDRYKKLIDADLEEYSKELTSATHEQFGDYSGQAMEVFCDVLSRGGKRIRGALTMLAYEMYGGTDQGVAIRAARIMEIVQTYLLVVDDVYDRSQTRRGKPSAHVMFEQKHKKNHWKDDSHHFGETIAFNCGLIGNHIAMTEVAKLPVNSEIAVRALLLLNTNLQITGEGQANDVFNEVVETVSKEQVDNVLIWKTAYYTFVNPLQFGAVLAGVENGELDRIREFSLAAGRVFQITDDILGTFGNEFESGKSPMDDLREGKRTLLTIHALQHAAREDGYYLKLMMGNRDLTMSDFNRCKEIISSAGSLEYAKSEAHISADHAMSLAHIAWGEKNPHQAAFLIGLIEYLLTRKS